MGADDRAAAPASVVRAAGTLSPRYRPIPSGAQTAFFNDVRCAKTTTFAE